MLTSSHELRRRGQAARAQLDDDSRQQFSQRICSHFLRSSLFLSARNLACYISTGSEVETDRVFERAWRMQKSIFAPVVGAGREMQFVRITRNTRLERNHFGIWEPVSGTRISPRKLDVVVTPLTIFDDQRHRIGMGGGYYDDCFRFLRHRREWLQPRLAGFAFACQKIEKISPNPWDIRLYRVFTEVS